MATSARRISVPSATSASRRACSKSAARWKRVVAILRDPLHKVFRPLAMPFASVLVAAALGFFHPPVYATIESVYFKVVQTHLLAKTSMFKTQDKPLAPAPNGRPIPCKAITSNSMAQAKHRYG